jgi:hypothetical protein
MTTEAYELPAPRNWRDDGRSVLLEDALAYARQCMEHGARLERERIERSAQKLTGRGYEFDMGRLSVAAAIRAG